MYPELFSHPKSAAAGRIAFRTVIVLVGLATADVLFWIGLDIAARLHWLPNNEFGERWMNLIHFVPLWREVVYGLAGAGMITALVLLVSRQRIGVPLFVVAVILERFDWAFHGFVSSTPETWFGYIELVLMVLAGTSVVVAMPLINWRQRQTDR